MLWSHGHLSWPAFSAIALTLAYVLVVDLLWRQIPLRAALFFPLVGAIWLGLMVALILGLS